MWAAGPPQTRALPQPLQILRLGDGKEGMAGGKGSGRIPTTVAALQAPGSPPFVGQKRESSAQSGSRFLSPTKMRDGLAAALGLARQNAVHGAEPRARRDPSDGLWREGESVLRALSFLSTQLSISDALTSTQEIVPALFLPWVRCAFQERETEAEQDGALSRAVFCILSGAEKLG